MYRYGTITYTYNADGIRTGKNIGGSVVEYILDGTKILAEQNGTHSIRYYYDPQGAPVGMNFDGTVYLYEKNLQGDIVGIYTTSGTKIATYVYDAWGKLVSSSYTSGYYDPFYYNPFRYRGYYYDTETGFYYLQSRYYDPTTGRFINADGMMAGTGSCLLGYNLYAYCFNNPISMQDSDGNWPEWLNKIENAVNSMVNTVLDLGKKLVLTAIATNVEVFRATEAEILPLGTGHGAEFGVADAEGAFYGITGPMLILDDGQYNVGYGGILEYSTSLPDGITIGNRILFLDSFLGEQYDISDEAGWQPIENEGFTLFSATAALGFGFHISISFNLLEYMERVENALIEIWGE